MKLAYFKQLNYLQAIKALFNELKVPMNYVADEPTSAEEILKDTYKDNETFQLINDVYFVGMIDDAAFEGNQSLDTQQIKSDYDGILVFGITLNQRDKNLLPTRSQLAEISRAFNREFYYTPVVLVFKYQNDEANYIAFANTERLKYKQTWREGEKAGKVSLLRDINIEKLHRGHEDIINQLRIPTSGTKVVDSFAKLYTYWQEVFSVSVLNKKFYQELSNWYFWAVKHVTFPNRPTAEIAHQKGVKLEDLIQEHNATNVIRLLTRILFTWFIKEKKLIPEELFDIEALHKNILKKISPDRVGGLFEEANLDSIYYKAILQNLFFASLNCPIQEDSLDKRARRFRLNNHYGQDRGNDWMYRYEKYFKDPDAFLRLMNSTVPFLNGGLFECLDIKHDQNLYIDGFSDQMTKGEQLIVPDYLFFGTAEEVDLSAEYGVKNKGTKQAAVKGLINILKSYKFTITENTPIEEDVALDPELLGKVFENLLASYNPETKTTARKQTGSFYTPREIVNYMVDESLIAYLKNAVSDWDMDETELDEKLHQLTSFDPVNPFDQNADLSKCIVKALDECTILDPACGSGAFPMGILQKMVHMLQKLDSQNEYWKEVQLKKAISATEEAYGIEDKKEREEKLIEINNAFDENVNDPDYARKLYLIENCIYGVDIQPIATQIAKLRFFISLVVDQKATDDPKDNFNIRPLPNLETKFVTANTLIGIEKPKDQLNIFDGGRIKELEAQLKKVRHKLFGARTKDTKLKYRQKDEELRNAIADELKQSGWPNDTAEKLAGWDPYDQNMSSPFFDPEWMFDISEGFDVIIGNPPFISYYARRSAKLSTSRLRYYQKHYDFITETKLDGKFNTIMFFLEKATTFSRIAGSTFFIVDVAFNDVPYRYIRKFLLKNTYVNKVIQGVSAFENVYSDQLLLQFFKSERNNTHQNHKIEIGSSLDSKENQIVNSDVFMSTKQFEFHLPENQSIQNIFGIMESCPSLHELFPNKLIRTCFSLAGHEDEFLLRNNSNEFDQPVLKYIQNAKNLPNRYSPLQNTEKIVFDENLRDKLNLHYRRDAYNENRRQPKALGLGSLYSYTQPKLFVRQSAAEIIATYEKEDCAANTSFYIINENDENGIKSSISILFLLGVLNSSVLTFYALKKNIIRTGQKKQPQMMIKPFRTLPIPKPKANESRIMEILVKLALLNPSSVKVSTIFSVIDSIVINLYFSDHMREREIDVLEFVERDLEKALQGREFDNLPDAAKEKVIEQLHATWSHPDNEVRNRMKLFAVRSPEILKPILES